MGFYFLETWCLTMFVWGRGGGVNSQRAERELLGSGMEC